MNNLTAPTCIRATWKISTLTLLAGLLGSLVSTSATAVDLASCRARCDYEKAECLVAAKDVLESERHRRKLEGIGPGEMKDLFPDLSALSPKKREGVNMIAELGSRYKDRVGGCEMTHKNCSMLDCTSTFR